MKVLYMNIASIFSGHCKQLDTLYECKFNVSERTVVDADRDNIKLNGFFLCNSKYSL